MEYLLHIVSPILFSSDCDNVCHISDLPRQANFFQYHITEPDEQSLYSYFAALANDEKPQAWTAPVQAGLSKLGTHWKGSYGEISQPHMTDTLERLLIQANANSIPPQCRDRGRAPPEPSTRVCSSSRHPLLQPSLRAAE